MPADNQIYEELADTWWDQDTCLHMLRSSFNARFDYFRHVLLDVARISPAGQPALDVGSGGGLLAEQFADLGFAVAGVDPSAGSLAAAERHARATGARVAYIRAVGERLPFRDASFGLVYCCDVLEHVASVDAVVAEVARVLQPDGVFCFDTINRTVRSWLVVVKVMQDWSVTALMPPGLHAWDGFIRPAELRAAFARHGLTGREMVGLAPPHGVPGALRMLPALHARAKGKISYAELSRRVHTVVSRNLSVSYAGWATKTMPTPEGTR
jgi:2-polyprenyl-6-hydroxyphenyl methylase / 3-demethylubiquinone-9 3-methyltransferase